MLLGTISRSELEDATNALAQADWTQTKNGASWARLSRPRGSGVITAIAVGATSPLRRVARTRLDPAQLEREGIVLIRDRDPGSELQTQSIALAGGSVCRTSLNLNNMEVTKTAGVSGLPDEDAIQRHLAEFEFLTALPRPARHLFPEVTTTTASEIGGRPFVQQRFVPGYTLGERVLRGELSGELLCKHAVELIDALEQSLWSSHTAATRQPSYVSVVSRRIRFLAERSGWFSRVWNVGLTANGVALPPLRMLLQEAASQWPELEHLEGRGAHGDLILDDVLLDVASSANPRIMLVDPNPSNVSWFVDIAKLGLSALLKYESILTGGFESRSGQQNGVPFMDVQLEPSAALSALDALADFLMGAIGPLAQRMGNRVLTARHLAVQAALHMLALPSFHAHHHGEVERGRAFCAIGMRKLFAEVREHDRVVPASN